MIRADRTKIARISAAEKRRKLHLGIHQHNKTIQRVKATNTFHDVAITQVLPILHSIIQHFSATFAVPAQPLWIVVPLPSQLCPILLRFYPAEYSANHPWNSVLHTSALPRETIANSPA